MYNFPNDYITGFIIQNSLQSHKNRIFPNEWLPSIICFSIYLNHEQAALAVMSHGSACWYHTDKPLHCSWKKILQFL